MNRYDHAGRVAGALARRGRVLVTHHESYGVIARRMLDSLVSEADIGRSNDGRVVTLANFSQINAVQLAAFDSTSIYAGPCPRSEAQQSAWDLLASRLAAEAGDNSDRVR